jgi:aspartyl-tRNA(Asn)/glutamyl-tRNA(Gln) amidotransferase subunit A
MSKRVNRTRSIFGNCFLNPQIGRLKGTDVLNQYDPQDPTSATPEQRAHAHGLIRKSLGGHDSPVTLKSLRIGVPSVIFSSPSSCTIPDTIQEYFPVELQSGVRGSFQEVLKVLAAAGAQLIPISLPSTQYALSAYYVISSAEASSNLARYNGFGYGKDFSIVCIFLSHEISAVTHGQQQPAIQSFQETRTNKFGAEVKRRILLGTYALMAEYVF